MSRLQALIKYKCPCCEEGDIYGEKKYFGFGKMHEKCDLCGHVYEKEPGFFYGAMYVSYGLTVAEGVAVFLITQFFFENIFNLYVLLFIGSAILILAPLNYKLSRVIWMYMFTSKETLK